MVLSRKPKRSRNIYCSPACGAKCRYEDYKVAKARANALAKRLGKQWKPRVWENFGWHYSVLTKDGKWFVYPSHSRLFDDSVTYSAGFNEDGNDGASTFWTRAKTPEKAIDAAWKRIKAYIAKHTPPPVK